MPHAAGPGVDLALGHTNLIFCFSSNAMRYKKSMHVRGIVFKHTQKNTARDPQGQAFAILLYFLLHIR